MSREKVPPILLSSELAKLTAGRHRNTGPAMDAAANGR